MDLRDTARAFIAEAFDALRAELVVPTPVFHPYVRVGRDYFGDTIHAVSAYHQLEEKLEALYPHRFADPPNQSHPEFADDYVFLEFAGTYVFSFLEAAIAACGRLSVETGQDHFDAGSEAVTESIEELIQVLDSPTYEAVCCRVVSHLTTEGQTEIKVGDITVVPEPEHSRGLIKRLTHEIAGGWNAFNREFPPPFERPHALLIIRERTDNPYPYEVVKQLSSKLDRFLLLARLFSAGTVHSHLEVRGTTTMVNRMDPHMVKFTWARPIVRRTVWLKGEHSHAFEAISQLIDEAKVKLVDETKVEREDMNATSFDIALSKFNSSHYQANHFEAIVDLATALEAVLADGKAKTRGITHKLSCRTSALLATDNDPEEAISGDVRVLYGLRSQLVHGGQIKKGDFRGNLRKISTVPKGKIDAFSAVEFGHAVDRLRDLVRRAILARLCLAAGPDPLWPFSGSIGVDSFLSDDSIRARWREAWHEHLTELGIGDATEPPIAAVKFLTPLDEEDQARREHGLDCVEAPTEEC